MSTRTKIQQVFDTGWKDFCSSHNVSGEQLKAAHAIMNCHSPKMGFNSMRCTECGHTEIHYNSCRNRNCPVCQAILKEVWVDQRRSEVIDGAYFHLVCTVPAELNPLIYANQKLLYSLMHDCAAKTVLSLAAGKKYLGAQPGIIQVLHTWGQKLNYHPHIHCIISGNGLSPDLKLVEGGTAFFLPVAVMRKVFRGKFLSSLQHLYTAGSLLIPESCARLRNSYEWSEFRDRLYTKDWNLYIKETFNGNGNAMEYLGRYTHRIAITNSRVLSVSDGQVSFFAFDYKAKEKVTLTLSCKEFIRRLMMHVLPSGFQKIRYFGFLSNRKKKKSLLVIFRLQGHQKFKRLYSGMKTDELLASVWGYNIHLCKSCGCNSMQHAGRTFPMRC